MKLATVRRHALALEATTEEPHHDYSSFRVRGKIFVTVPPDATAFVGVRDYIFSDTVLLDLIRQRRTMEAVLLRHDVGRQSIGNAIENTTDSVVKLSRSQDWKHVQSTFGVQDIAHIPDLNVVLAAVGFTREKREPERTPDEIPVKLNPFEEQVRSAAKGKAILYAFRAQTEALWIRLDPIKVLQWCVKHAGWDLPPPDVMASPARAQAHLLTHSPALTAAPGSAAEITKSVGASPAAPFHRLHSIAFIFGKPIVKNLC